MSKSKKLEKSRSITLQQCQSQTVVNSKIIDEMLYILITKIYL